MSTTATTSKAMLLITDVALAVEETITGAAPNAGHGKVANAAIVLTFAFTKFTA